MLEMINVHSLTLHLQPVFILPNLHSDVKEKSSLDINFFTIFPKKMYKS